MPVSISESVSWETQTLTLSFSWASISEKGPLSKYQYIAQAPLAPASDQDKPMGNTEDQRVGGREKSEYIFPVLASDRTPGRGCISPESQLLQGSPGCQLWVSSAFPFAFPALKVVQASFWYYSLGCHIAIPSRLAFSSSNTWLSALPTPL